MAQSTLPSMIVLGSPINTFGKFFEETGMYSRLYLGCVRKGSEYENHLKYDFKATDPATKFAIEPADCGGGLVHIKSCYNNKYLCRKDGNTRTIVAEATEQVEDISTWMCTLFKPSIASSSEGEQTVVFRHVETDFDVHIADDNFDGPRNFLTVDNTAGQSRKLAESVFVDCQFLVTLPKFVAFKAQNDQYLKLNDNATLKFNEKDLGSENIVHEVHLTGDGTARFKNLKNGMFWQCYYNVVLPNALDDEATKLPSVFNVVNVDAEKSIVALYSAYSKTFCRPLQADMILIDGSKTIVKEDWFQVDEPVYKRKVEVKFHLEEANIYDQSVDNMAEASGDNDSYTETDGVTLQKTVEYTESRTWTNTVGISMGVETTFETGIPVIAEGKITVKAEAEYQHQWAHTQEEKESITASYNMKLEPRTKGTVKMVATRATCDIPFSYTQTDTLYSGQKVTTNLKDGVYRGAQYYNFHYETKRESIDEDNPRVETLVVPHPSGR